MGGEDCDDACLQLFIQVVDEEEGEEEAPEADEEDECPYAVGDKVQAQFEDDEWCTGTVQKIKDNDRIRVVWEDNSYTDHTASELRPAPKQDKKDKKPPKPETSDSQYTEYEE